ncbi:MAG: hypothetical protein EBU90_27610 [Proteobacteria bacterium]|nr:hypothetical protein [Pseudomonadota bacterium]
MTMHLVGPWLSTTGKKKGKVKFASAEAKRKALELDAEWSQLQKKLETKKAIMPRSLTRPISLPKIPPGRDTTSHIKSHDSGASVAAKKENPVYTGTKVIGVSIVHKSCLQPVFSDEQAKDFASMRR